MNAALYVSYKAISADPALTADLARGEDSMRWIPDDVRCQLNPRSRALLKRGAAALVRSERVGGTSQ